MRRFVYAPDVEAYIHTGHGILDVSNDIINGSMTLRLNGVSSFSLTLQNPHRKYLGNINAMDPIVIYLTRVKRMLSFSGYVDVAPIDQLYPEPVTVAGSCTLKRLLHTYWNPQLPYVEQFLYSMGWTLDPLTGNLFDNTGKSLWNLDAEGSLGNMLQQILHKMGGWDLGTNKKGKRVNSSKNSVQILALPKEFITVSTKLLTTQRHAQAEYQAKVTNFLNNLLSVNGITTDPFGSSSATANNASDNVTDTNPLPKKIAGKYKATTYGPKTNLTGFAAAFEKQARKKGEAVTAEQAQNASIIVQSMKANGINDRAAAAFVAIAWKAESGLLANRVQDGATKGTRLNVGYGLFQLTETTSTDEWIGPNGWVAKAVRRLTHKRVTVTPGDKYELNATYNSYARAMSLSGGDKDTLNNSSDPVAIVSRIQVHSSVSPWTSSSPNGPDYNNSTKNAYHIVWQALQSVAKNNNNQTSNTGGNTGSVGNVRVGNPGFFDNSQAQSSHGHGGGDSTSVASNGYTFRIKPNPYGNDTFIFAATEYDPSLKRDEISIWCPQDAVQGQNWKDKEVSIETSLPGKPFPPSSGTSNAGENVSDATKALSFALTQIGTPYGWGDEKPGVAFDCSGLTQWAYSKINISLPHNAQLQYNQGPVVPSTDALQPGDLVFFGSSKSNIGHVGIFIHPNQMVDAPHTGAHVRKEWMPSNIGGSWGSDRFVGATRPAGGASSSTKATTPDTSNSGVQMNSSNFAQATAAFGMGLPMVFPMAQDALEAQLFTGERAYQDAQPLMNLVDFICKASGRNFKSTPRGDFFAFYPDYFNWAGQSPYFVITDIELQDLTVNFTDEPLATHVYTTADTMAAGNINISEELFSTVASVETLGSFPELVNVRKHFDYKHFLEKFGARPMNEEIPEIKNSFMQFMYGWMTFLEQWAKLFEANPTFTFMPELIPGGLIRFKSKDLTMYINEVTHNFDRTSGFTTTANLIAPSTSDKGSYSMMVINGNLDTSKV